MQELLVVHDWARVRRIDLYERLRSGRQFTEAEITSLVERLRRPSTVPVVVKLAVDRSITAEHGHIVIADLKCEPVCKRLCKRGPNIILLSENAG